jgi:hypothetical protein
MCKTWKSSGLTVACCLSQSRRVRSVIERAAVEDEARLRTSCDEDGSEKTNGSVFWMGGLMEVRRGKGRERELEKPKRQERAQLPASVATVRACLIRPATSSNYHQSRAFHGQANHYCRSLDIVA